MIGRSRGHESSLLDMGGGLEIARRGQVAVGGWGWKTIWGVLGGRKMLDEGGHESSLSDARGPEIDRRGQVGLEGGGGWKLLGGFQERDLYWSEQRQTYLI